MSENKTRELTNILNLKELEKLFKNYSYTSGLDIVLYDTDGEGVLSVKTPNCICNFINNEQCRSKIKYSGEKANELNSAYIYETACGLVMCITAVKIENQVIGYIATGPVSLWDKDDYFEKQFKENCLNMGYDILANNYDFDKIKQVSCEYVTSSAELLTVLVNYMALEERKYRAERTEIVKLRLERLKAQGEMEIQSNSLNLKKYPIELEKELIAYVHLGEKNKAKLIINKFLNEIFSYASGKLDIIKAKLYEFVSFLSRAAVEAGAPIDSLASIIKESSKLFLENIDFQDLCLTTIEILNQFIDVVYESRGQRITNVYLANAIDYINKNYQNEIMLETVAKTVFVSPSYLSHLFRDEMNITFSDYVSKVRIEKAKELLRSGISVENVAEQVGFAEANYFIKIFKKQVGITPAKYKKLFI